MDTNIITEENHSDNIINNDLDLNNYKLKEVERISKEDLSYERFMIEYWVPGKPVIITNAINHWEGMTKWHPLQLKERLGKNIVSVRQTQHNGYRTGTTYTTENMKFADYVDSLYNERVHKKSGIKRTYYMAVQNIKEVFPEIRDEYRKEFEYIPLTHRGPFLWVAPKGHYEYCHVDPDDNFLAIVNGKKKLLLVPPSEFESLYPHPLGSLGYTLQSQIDLVKGVEGVNLEDFPLFKKAIPSTYLCEVTDGEVLFLPFGYWHQVTSEEITVSVNFFCGDREKGDYIGKLLKSPRWEPFSYWLLNIIEQNRCFYTPPSRAAAVFRNLDRYSDAQLIDCISYFMVNRYHEGPQQDQYPQLVKLLRDYCNQRDQQEIELGQAMPTDIPKKAPRIKIRGKKWRLQP